MSKFSDLETEYIPSVSKFTNKELLQKRKIAEDVSTARVYLGLIVFLLLFSSLLLAGILACLLFIVWRLFAW